MILRLVDWIWLVRGVVSLAPGQSGDDAFDKLRPLLRQSGTSHMQTKDTLSFRKRDPAAQDKLSIFDHGVLHIEQSPAGPVLRYELSSRALLFCFFAPLLFLAIAQLTVVIGKYQHTPGDAASKPSKAATREPPARLNPIDKALGAPAPEAPGKSGKADPEGPDKKPSPTPGYVFAGIFAALYVGGRILEAWLVKALFKNCLLGVNADA